ncbi:MAG: trigger factor [Verrucomicrobia bacterium]|nr:trigger factor [Verrucomicrobiota bacterium]MBT3842535.1 trigger factor [Verrucomicrobiota bacterium]MBT5619809.1 trigger factor [Verrucomicrobiota bacterium]MBT6788584.1 trigger factor [Verrucomicrobiota bacterium]MBT7028482.1 trigger factor [Verrucomicrobiota bacterium]
MEVTITDLSPCKKQLRIEIDAETVNAKFDAVAKDFRRHANLPGFRPGKAPLANVMRSYGDKIGEEAKRTLMSDSYSKALKENDLRPVIMPEVEDLQFGHGKPFQYLATLEVTPSFELPDYNGIEVEKERRTVSDSDVAKALDTLREQRVSYADVDRSAGEDDFIVVNFTGTIDDKPITDLVKVARGLTEQKNFWLHTKQNPLIPGIVEALIGSGKDDKKTVTVTIPDDFIYEELIGKEAKYEIEIVQVKEKFLPELDDAFAKGFGAESMEKLREGVENDLKNELEYSLKKSIRNQCVDKLLSAVNCDLPETIVNEATRAAVHNIVQQNHQRGVGKDIIEENKDRIYANAKADAEVRVRANYILSRIAEKEGIKVTDQELSRQIAAIAAQQKVKPQKLAQQLKDNGTLYQVQEEIMNGKVIDLLEEKAKVTEIDPKPEEEHTHSHEHGKDCGHDH